MRLMPRFRLTAALAGALLLVSCATTHESTDDPRAWSYSPMVEARKFYASGLSVDDYIKGKPLDGINAVNVFFLCNGFIEAGDEIRMEQCRRAFDRIAAEPRNKPIAQTFDQYREYIFIYSQQFLLEQSRFAEVEKNLMPYLSRDAAVFTFDRAKAANFNYRVMAAPILARAQRNTGGLKPVVRDSLGEMSKGAIGALGALMNPKGMAIVVAEAEYLQGNYEACYQKVSRSSSGGVGLIKLLGAPIDQMYGGASTAMDRMLDVMFMRLQALCAYEAGRADEAALSYRDILKLPDAKPLKGLQRLANYHLALLALKKNQRDEAIAHLKVAVDALESERAAIDSEAGRLGYVTNKSDIYAQLVEQLVAAGQDAEAFEYAERGKSRALVDMLATRRAGQPARPEDGVLARAMQRVDDADSAQRGMAGVAGASGTGAAATAGATRSISVRQEIARANPHLGSLVTVAALPVAEVQKHLRPRETLIEYFGEGDRLFAFVVTQSRIKALRLDAKAVASQGRAFRRVLTDPAARDYQAQGKRMHDAVLAPALAHADGGPLTIVPHGALHYIPFAALYDGRQFLVQSAAELRTLPSASVLPFLSGAPAGAGLLILGNPDLGDRKLDLPGAEEEARRLERMNRGSRVLLRAQASETALRKLGPQAREIHFAMHGKFDSANPLSSGLYMARDAENDGVLTVGELYDLRLAADLVVLSACETALADASKGDDLVGLNRGFLFAGAKSIVSSLWEVDDNATRDLMVSFYQQRAQYGKAGALRRAQLAALPKYPHPFYWAAFQVSGVF